MGGHRKIPCCFVLMYCVCLSVDYGLSTRLCKFSSLVVF